MSGMADAEALYGLHKGRVFRYLCRAVGQADTERDLTQHVFLRVARSSPPDGTRDAQRGWVFRIARNVAIDHRRKEIRRPAPVAADPETAGRTASQDIVTAVNQALDAIDELDRDVFLMREV